MRVHLKDIAKKAGVSVNTVSLALRGSPRVAEATRAEITKIAERLSYVPNEVARALVEKKTRTVGVILADIMNPILTATTQFIERKLREHGFSIFLMTTHQQTELEHQALDALRARQVDGILLYPVSRHKLDHVDVLQKAGYPIILLAGSQSLPYDVVSINNTLGAYKAVSHLAHLGHRQIGFINGGTSIGHQDKFNGYVSALKEWGLSYKDKMVIDPHGFGYEHGYQAIARIFKQDCSPTALFTSSDILALGALRWCIEKGIRVPEDLAIIGYDDIEASRYASVPLSSIKYRPDLVSEQAINRLLQLIEAKTKGGSLSKPKKVLIEPELVIRSSCGGKKPERVGNALTGRG